MSLLAILTVLLPAFAASAQEVSFGAPMGPIDMPEAPAPAAARAPAAPPPVRTRFIVSLGSAIPANEVKVRALNGSNRVLVDLPQVGMRLPELPPADSPAGVVRSFRYLSPAPGRTRLVIDVTGPVVVEKTVEKSPSGIGHRLVLEIAANAANAGVPTPKRVSRRKAAKPVIVIDPGHGGHDSGAMKYGTVEKDVVLSFSLKLQEKLLATDYYKVVMTRDTDVFLPLHERREIAERNSAALFIAIHADYTERASARGATIYSLRPNVAATLRRAAAARGETDLTTREVAPLKRADASGGELSTVRGILADKARDLIEINSQRTSVLARSLVNYVGTSTNLMENPDRNAAFAVLKTAKVPAILLELGYVTNLQDAAQLKSDRWRDRVAASLVTAINKFVSECRVIDCR